MPRISDVILDCVAYLYPSIDDAVAGEAIGGSGFLVGWRTKGAPSVQHVYAVTNAHVIHSGPGADDLGCPILRLNTTDGKFDVLERHEADWFPALDGADIAVTRIDETELRGKRYRVIGLSTFLTRNIITEYNIGPGDECFMVGRFINHEGKQRNLPMLRFGNLSMMPWEDIKGWQDIPQESFIVEMRSRSGFSGSPVFVYIPPSSVRMDSAGLNMQSDEMYGPWLLGVEWGQIPSADEDSDGVAIGAAMLCATPAWRLMELLMEDPDVKAQREAIEADAAKGGYAIPETSTAKLGPSTKADNPQHREDFNRLLGAAVQKPERDDRT